ncbi:MAG: choice-of-anchor J domain-containing protein [Candidatus Cloacimonetes bacterium]|nr:choice-of-anchor J domain-containing protein [Candidatus Cloacimonadota bacterium]
MIWELDTVDESPGAMDRANMYGVSGIPHVQFQGTIPEIGGGDTCYTRYLGRYNAISPTNSPIDLSFTYSPTATGLDVVADVTMTGNVTSTNNKIMFIVTRHITNSYFCTVEVYEMQDFTQTTTAEVGQYTQSLTLDPSWNLTDLRIVVMVQTLDTPFTIIQASRGDIVPDSEINVTVTNMYTNLPVAGATVHAGSFTATTNANGECTVDVLGGTYDVLVEKEGYIDNAVTGVTADPDNPATVSVQLDELVLPPSYLTQDVAGNWVWLTWLPPASPEMILEEGFQGGTLPAGWTNSTNSASGWHVTMNGGSQYFAIPGHGYYIVSNDDAANDDGSMDYLIMPTMDLSGLLGCTLSFASYYDGTYGQLATVEISTDGGANWEVLAAMTAGTSWQNVSINLDEYLDETAVTIAFHSDDAGEWASGWAIDDVTLGFEGINTLVQGYNIYMDDSTTPSNPELVTELEYIVTDVPLGQHTFEVKALFSPGESDPCQEVPAEVTVDMPFYPPTIFSYGVEYIRDITVAWNVPNPVRIQKMDSEGNVYGEADNDNLTRDHIGYNVYRDGELVQFVSGTNTTQLTLLDHEFGSFVYQFRSVYAEGESFAFGELIVLVQEQEIPALFVDDIEECELWSDAGYPWITYDLDGLATYSIVNTSFPGSGGAMPFIVFDPQSTTPPMAEYQTAFSGDKCFATFATETGSNDDWLISDVVTLYNLPYVGFWAKSLSTQYGSDEFEVAVSMGGTDVSDFTVLTGSTPLSVPQGWTRVEVDLGDYEDQTVRVGIHCVSEGTLAFLIDNIGIYSAGGVGNDEQNDVQSVNRLISNYPNPFNPETTIAYEIKNNGHVSMDIYNILGKKVRTLINEEVTAGQHNVVWNGTDDNGKNVSSGVYFYKLTSGDFSATNKMILMK